jgi:transcription initiation factor TFIIIB Brf1 subunit/transcription initiation factor TFIIB
MDICEKCGGSKVYYSTAMEMYKCNECGRISHRCETDEDPKSMERDLHAEAGLIESGLDDEGNVNWLGTKKQWDKFDELTK